MSITLYHFLHVVALLVLAGGTAYACAAASGTRRTVLILTGVASLVLLVSGFGLLAKIYHTQFYLWVVVKLGCWLGLSALAGLAYRRRARAGLWLALGALCVTVGVAMVYFRPGW